MAMTTQTLLKRVLGSLSFRLELQYVGEDLVVASGQRALSDSMRHGEAAPTADPRLAPGRRCWAIRRKQFVGGGGEALAAKPGRLSAAGLPAGLQPLLCKVQDRRRIDVGIVNEA